MSEKRPGKLVFACGGTIESCDASGHKVGERLVVGTHPHRGHSRPEVDGVEMGCCFHCPSTIKKSGRKFVEVKLASGQTFRKGRDTRGFEVSVNGKRVIG